MIVAVVQIASTNGGEYGDRMKIIHIVFLPIETHYLTHTYSCQKEKLCHSLCEKEVHEEDKRPNKTKDSCYE